MSIRARRPGYSSRLPLVVAALAMGLVLACTDRAGTGESASGATTGAAASQELASDGAPVDTSFEVETPADSPTVGVARAQGELTKPLQDYVQDPAGFLRIVRSASWKGMRRPRRCSGDPACDRPSNRAKTVLVVEAVRDAHLLELPKIPQYGRTVLRLKNVGRYTDVVYPIPRSPAGGYQTEFYIVVLPSDEATLASEQKLVELSFDQAARPSIKISDIGASFLPCPEHQEPKHNVGWGDFRGCPGSAAPAAKRIGNFGTQDTEPEYEFALAWSSCSYGCCSSGFPITKGGGSDSLRSPQRPQGM